MREEGLRVLLILLHNKRTYIVKAVGFEKIYS